MRKKYDCQVQLPDSAGNPERVLTVIGERTNCVGVFEECLEKVKNEIRRRDNHAPIEVQVLIPQPFMGTIIGTGGTKIKDLRKRSGANIKIFSEPMPFSNERSISLSGTEEQIVNCVSFFLQEIGQREPKEPIILYDPSLPPDMPHHLIIHHLMEDILILVDEVEEEDECILRDVGVVVEVAQTILVILMVHPIIMDLLLLITIVEYTMYLQWEILILSLIHISEPTRPY